MLKDVPGVGIAGAFCGTLLSLQRPLNMQRIDCESAERNIPNVVSLGRLLNDSAALALWFNKGASEGQRWLSDFGYAYVLPTQRQKLTAPSTRTECKAKE